MKTTFKAIVLAASMVVAGSAFAQTDLSSLNELTSAQSGVSSVGDAGAAIVSGLISSGGALDLSVAGAFAATDNVAFIGQNGDGSNTNTAFIDQSGGAPDNVAIILQDSVAGAVPNTAAIMQFGGANHAVIYQH